MAKRYKMTWNWTDKAKTVGRWQKKYKGKRFTCKPKVGESKTSSYARAWAAFELWRADQDKARQGVSQEQQDLVAYYADALLVVGKYYGDEGYEHSGAIQLALNLLKTPQDNIDDYKLQAVLNDRMLRGKIIAERRMRAEQAQANSPQQVTVRAAITLYMRYKQQQDLSVARLSNVCMWLDEFATFCNDQGTRSINKLTEAMITKYTLYIGDKHTSDETISTKFKAVKPFVKWCWRQRYITADIRNLDDLSHRIKNKPKPKHYTLDELRILYAAANDRMKLYLLYAINTGSGQLDISTLHSDHLTDDGAIVRQRSKTGIWQRHVLWAETARQLNEQKNKGKGLLLTGKNDLPLVQSHLNNKDRIVRKDAIRDRWRTLNINAGITGTFYQLRKTGANLLVNEILTAEQQGLVELYLGHGSKKMSDHYANRNLEILDEPLAHLGTLIMAALKG